MTADVPPHTRPDAFVQQDLRPDEDAVFGQWLDTGSRLERDHAWARIQWLTRERLALVTPGEGGLTALYRDPADGRLWELRHPYGHLPGRGPPHLVHLAADEARRHYGPHGAE